MRSKIFVLAVIAIFAFACDSYAGLLSSAKNKASSAASTVSHGAKNAAGTVVQAGGGVVQNKVQGAGRITHAIGEQVAQPVSSTAGGAVDSTAHAINNAGKSIGQTSTSASNAIKGKSSGRAHATPSSGRSHSGN